MRTLSQTSVASDRSRSSRSKNPSCRTSAPSLMRSEISEAARAYTYPIRCCSRDPSSLDDISAPSHCNAIAALELTAPPMSAPSGPPKRKPVAVPAIPEKPPPAISAPLSIRRRVPTSELTGFRLSAVTFYSLAVVVAVSYSQTCAGDCTTNYDNSMTIRLGSAGRTTTSADGL